MNSLFNSAFYNQGVGRCFLRARSALDVEGIRDYIERDNPVAALNCQIPLKRTKYGVTDGARTHDNRNHNPGLYQLSYSHHENIKSHIWRARQESNL